MMLYLIKATYSATADAHRHPQKVFVTALGKEEVQQFSLVPHIATGGDVQRTQQLVRHVAYPADFADGQVLDVFQHGIFGILQNKRAVGFIPVGKDFVQHSCDVKLKYFLKMQVTI